MERMDANQAFDAVVQWGFVFIVACALVAVGLSFFRGE